MDLINGNLKKTYLQYLFASFGGAILPSVYGLVDMIVVGRYHGPDGAATMAIIAPIWNVIFSSGLLTGIGASILFNVQKNLAQVDKTKANGFFTVGLLLTTVISLFLWFSLFLFEDSILKTLGADEILLPYAQRYLIPVKFSVPLFLFMQFMAGFLRNDGNPSLSSKAVLIGGLFNILGDIFFVFAMDLGILGAGIATCLGAGISLSVMLFHFKSDKNTLKIVKPKRVFHKSKQILQIGFSTFFLDFSVGIVTMLFNIQIMKHLDSNSLAVYGILVNLTIFVQCCAYGVGQASQPILSANYSRNRWDRIATLFRYNVVTTSVISGIWVVATLGFPNTLVSLFMTPTAEVLEIAPKIIRIYCLAFVLLPFNVYATYFFQSTMKPFVAFVISVSRGLVVSGVLILLLPPLFTADSIWFVMPMTEFMTFLYILIAKCKYQEPKREVTSKN